MLSPPQHIFGCDLCNLCLATVQNLFLSSKSFLYLMCCATDHWFFFLSSRKSIGCGWLGEAMSGSAVLVSRSVHFIYNSETY